jgi:hypothetical protein
MKNVDLVRLVVEVGSLRTRPVHGDGVILIRKDRPRLELQRALAVRREPSHRVEDCRRPGEFAGKRIVTSDMPYDIVSKEDRHAFFEVWGRGGRKEATDQQRVRVLGQGDELVRHFRALRGAGPRLLPFALLLLPAAGSDP